MPWTSQKHDFYDSIRKPHHGPKGTQPGGKRVGAPEPAPGKRKIRILAVDPGHKYMWTATDQYGKTRRYATAQYKERAGFGKCNTC